MKSPAPESIVAIMAAVVTALGILGTQFYNRLKNRRDEQAADDVLSERIIELVEKEADKRVAVVKAEFELKIANLKLEHATQLSAMREDFDRQLAEIRAQARDYHCDIAANCNNRVINGVTVQSSPGGTD